MLISFWGGLGMAWYREILKEILDKKTSLEILDLITSLVAACVQDRLETKKGDNVVHK